MSTYEIDHLRVNMLLKRVEAQELTCDGGSLLSSRDWIDLKRELDPTDRVAMYQVEDGWMETYVGLQFHFSDPPDRDIHIVDIAHALSMLCRYNGHTHKFYSVAEHCCLISDYVLRALESAEGTHHVNSHIALTALLHDAAEAYIGDMCRPVKVTLPDFKAMETVIDLAMARKFGTICPFPPIIKECDNRILRDEREQVMSDSGHEWGTDALEPLGVDIACWSPERAKGEFLGRFHSLSLDVSGE